MLRQTLSDADKSGIAIAHFNVSESVALKAVADAARELNAPVIVGLSEGERKFFGTQEAAAIIRTIRDTHGQRIYLNADHTHSLESALAAASAGFDSVVFDRSDLPFDQNIRETRQAVQELRSINPEIIVEGEIGDIGTGSQIHEKAPDRLILTTPEEAMQFVKETGVDVLAPAVGNMHGMLKTMIHGAAEKRLDIPRIREVKGATGIFLTLHGGSGTNEQDIQVAIRAGITVVHVNTELRLAWRNSLEKALQANKDEVVPYKLLAEPLAAMRSLVRRKIELFSSSTQSRAA
jgi:fructose-bisphosphate aldolase class II